MGKQAPAPGDYVGAAQQTAQQGAQLNRPNQRNAMGGSLSYSTGPNGEVTQTQEFTGPLSGLNQALLGQAASAGANPLDFSQFGELGTGDSARQQAIDAAYQQSASRLNPMFQQREDNARARLIAQGLDPSSQAFKNEMGNMGRERADAYQSALNAAIGQGTAAGQAVFGQNLQARQQAISEALRRRSQPMEELRGLQGLLQQPGVQQVAGPNLLGALTAQDAARLGAWNATNQANTDLAGGIFDLLKSGAGIAALSDERAKQDIVRHSAEVLPGVPLATWRYRHGYGAPGWHAGVIAQDLEAAGVGEYVSRRPDGMRTVDYARLLEAANAR